MHDPAAKRTIAWLRSKAHRTAQTQALVGFDGFVDTIVHIVKTRHSQKEFKRYESMADWAAHIAAASGLSGNFELAPQRVKLGGNGPIMADALARLGAGVTCIGNLGKPSPHPVFADFAKRARIISIAEPGFTDAFEFADGKLMCSKLDTLRAVNWRNLVRHVPEAELVRLFSASSLIAMVNWTMLVNLTGIFRNLLTRILPKLHGPQRTIFFDLADPAKRPRKDLLTALRIIGRYGRRARVILGLNLGEARQVSDVLGLGGIEEKCGPVAHAAAAIRRALQIDTVVIHPVHFAAAADAHGTAHIAGPYCPMPKITTGAGDHFNAGFCLARIHGLGLAESLHAGVGMSGYYVRHGKSPTPRQLAGFLRAPWKPQAAGKSWE